MDTGRPDSPKQGAELTADQAIELIRQLIGGGLLPTPSIVARSGRGVYLIYLLTASHEGARRPVPRSEETEKRWKHVAKSLALRVADLACDAIATATLAHAYKAPGKDDEPATYFAVGTDTRTVRYWLLDELEARLPRPQVLNLPVPPPGERRNKRRSSDPASPMRLRLMELEQLARHRGGIAEGQRHNFLLYYTTDHRRLLKVENVSWKRALKVAIDRARELNLTFSKPLDDYDVHGLSRADASFKKRHRNETVAEALAVTEAEVLQLGLKCLLPRSVAARRQGSKEAKRAARRMRLALLDQMILAGAATAEIKEHTNYSKSAICARRLLLPISSERQR